MEGCRSRDHNFVFGYPKELNQSMLPTESDIVNYSLHLRKEKINSAEWKQDIPGSEVARVVADHICDIWDNTGIPHFGQSNPQWMREKVDKLLIK